MVDDLHADGPHPERPIENAVHDHSSFGETFFGEARVPVANLVGEENRGWYVAMTLMDVDRASIPNTAEDRAKIHGAPAGPQHAIRVGVI